MATYLISYDLKRVKNYPRLYACLNQWGAKRVLESLWVAHLVGPSPAVCNILLRYIDGDDALAVFELAAGADWATYLARLEGVAQLQRTAAIAA